MTASNQVFFSNQEAMLHQAYVVDQLLATFLFPSAKIHDVAIAFSLLKNRPPSAALL